MGHSTQAPISPAGSASLATGHLFPCLQVCAHAGLECWGQVG